VEPSGGDLLPETIVINNDDLAHVLYCSQFMLAWHKIEPLGDEFS